MIVTPLIWAALVRIVSGQSTPMQGVPLAPASDQVMVMVNGKPILAKEMEPYLWDWRASEVLGDVITYRLIADEAKKQGVSVSPAAIEKAVSEQTQAILLQAPPGVDAEKNLRDQGFPKSRFYLKIQGDLLLEQIVLQHFSPKDFVRIAALAFRPKSSARESLEASQKLADAAFTRLKNGGAWKDELNSSDDQTALKEQDGSLGWRRLSGFPPATQGEIRKGKAGMFTRPTEVGGIVQLFRLDAKGDAVPEAELDQLKRQFVESERDKLMTQLRKTAKIDQFYVGAPRPVNH